jgi:hypothetical protein
VEKPSKSSNRPKTYLLAALAFLLVVAALGISSNIGQSIARKLFGGERTTSRQSTRIDPAALPPAAAVSVDSNESSPETATTNLSPQAEAIHNVCTVASSGVHQYVYARLVAENEFAAQRMVREGRASNQAGMEKSLRQTHDEQAMAGMRKVIEMGNKVADTWIQNDTRIPKAIAELKARTIARSKDPMALPDPEAARQLAQDIADSMQIDCEKNLATQVPKTPAD